MLLLHLIAYFLASVIVGMFFLTQVYNPTTVPLWQGSLVFQLFLVINILLVIKTIQYGII